MTTGLTPYITPKVLLANSYGIDWRTFPRVGASSDEALAAQIDACWAATSEMNTAANQSLRAGVDTESEFGPDLVVTVGQNGWARMRLTRSPVLRLVGGAVSPAGSSPPAYQAIPASAMLIEHGLTHDSTIVPVGAGPQPTAALIAPGRVTWQAGRNGFLLQVTTVSGYPTAGIDEAADAGAASVHVDDVTGWWDPDRGLGAAGVILDPPWREEVRVASMTPDTAGAISGPGTLGLTAPLQFPHTPLVGSAVGPDQRVLLTAMPAGLRQAALYFALSIALARGTNAAAVQTGRGGSQASTGNSSEYWRGLAEKAVKPYARTW